MNLQTLNRSLHYWAEDVTFSLGLRRQDGSVPHVVKRRVIREYARRFQLQCFVETGTYLGDMVTALCSDFPILHSIELSEGLYRQAVQRFRHQPHIHLYQGDSATCLRSVLNQLDRPALFWLDAHYSGGITAQGDGPCPLEQELPSILTHTCADHIVLIDDARYFIGQSGYPSLNDIRRMVDHYRDGQFSVTIELDIIRLLPRSTT